MRTSLGSYPLKQGGKEEVSWQLRRVDTLLVLLSKGRRRKTEKEKDFFRKTPLDFKEIS